MIIGIGHAARVGKDSLARILVRDHGFVRLSLASPLKSMVYSIDPCLAMLVDIHGWNKAKDLYPALVRQPLIEAGLACRKHLGPDVFINAVTDHMEPGIDYCISDVRFPNELDWVLKRGIAVRVTRPGVCPLDNEPDQALASCTRWSTTIANDGTLYDLAGKATGLVRNAPQLMEAYANA